MRIPLTPLALLAVTSCVAAPPAPRPVAPPPAATPARATAIANPLPPDWRDWPLTAGTWRYQAASGGSAATFGSGSGALAAVRCVVATRTVRVIAFGMAEGSGLVRASDLARRLSFAADADALSGVSTSLAANDLLLDAIAFSRGRWTIDQPGRTPLVLPAYAEVARVVEDCRK